MTEGFEETYPLYAFAGLVARAPAKQPPATR